MYVNIPYMDPMGRVLYIPGGFLAGFLNHRQYHSDTGYVPKGLAG